VTTEKCFKNRGAFKAKTLVLLSIISALVVVSTLNRSIALADQPRSESLPALSSAQHSAPQSHPTVDFRPFDLSGILKALRWSEIVWEGGFERNPLSRALFDLVQYMKNNVQPKPPGEVLATVPPYRRTDFGIWVNEDGPANCYNTRAEVLIRDATPTSAVKFDTANPCKIIRGEWADPYSGTDFKLASAVQVDHVVPLKNAYRSGAHAWTKERRCHFGNFLRDENHLLSVSGRENMSKGDSGPEDYLPPNSSYVCTYLANWMRIKAVWNLEFSRDESIAIERSLRDNGCASAMTTIKLKEVVETRRQTMVTNMKCLSPAPRPVTPSIGTLGATSSGSIASPGEAPAPTADALLP